MVLYNILNLCIYIVNIPLTISAEGLTLAGVSSSILMGRRRRVKRGKLWLVSNEQLANALRRGVGALTVLKILEQNYINKQ